MTRAVFSDRLELWPTSERQREKARARRREREMERYYSQYYSQYWDFDSFRVSASCPPDNRIHIRGGWAWQPGSSYGGIYKSTNLGDIAYIPWDYFTYFGFVNANWYLPIIVTYPVGFNRLRVYTLFSLTLGAAEDEYGTAAEAEAAVERWWTDRVWGYGVPLPPLILRNNGNTVDNNQFLDIDPVNRGRSYIWQREMRGTYEI